jgi:RNA recognition motif-containing protein
LGYAYANFYSHSQAVKVLKALDKQTFHQKPLRIVWHDKARLSNERRPHANIFIKNFPPSIDARRLEDCFQVVFFVDLKLVFTCQKLLVKTPPKKVNYESQKKRRR